MSEEDLIETFEIRLALELLAGKRAIHRWNKQSSQTFERLLKGLAKPVTSEETLKQHEALNREFHFALFELAGSRKLSELYQSLHAHIQIARIHATEEPNLPRLAARLQQEQVEHAAIVSALEERSITKLEEALRNHILRAQESLRAAIHARDAQLATDEPAKNGKRKRV